MANTSDTTHPFGGYIKQKFARGKEKIATELLQYYDVLNQAKTLDSLIASICGVQVFVDKNLDKWPALLGGKVTPFSTFRGYFLEEAILRLAQMVVESRYADQGLGTIKFSTGQGLVTGVALEFRRNHVPDPVRISLRRDREDVVVGFRRTLEMVGPNNQCVKFPDEVVPVCIVACKMYIDATRLENVLAKAKNMLSQHSTCTFLVASDWDALGADWHDSKGRILDSLTAPIDKIIFLRGDTAKRPENSELQKQSVQQPYQAAQLKDLAESISSAVGFWHQDKP